MAAAALLVGPTAPAAVADETAQTILARYTPPDGELDPVLAAVAAGTINLHVPPLRPGQIAPDPVETGYAILGEDLGGFDVTATVEGQAEIEAFRQQLRDRGEIAAATANFVIYSLPDLDTGGVSCSVGIANCDDVHVDPRDIDLSDPEHPVDTTTIDNLVEGEGPLGSTLVVPAGTAIELVGGVVNVNAGGGIFLKTLLSTAPSIVLPGPGGGGGLHYDDPGNSTSWTPAGGRCLERKSNNTAWYNPCLWWYHRKEDGNADRQTYGLNQYGTGKSKSFWVLEDLEVESWRRKGTADQDWVDWSPDADIDVGNCTTGTVSVTVNGVGLEHSSSHCDKWDIDLGSAPADFSNHWRGSANRSERATDMMIATSVPNGHVPVDYVDYDYYAR